VWVLHNSGRADLTLTNCQAIGCNVGIHAPTQGPASATVRIANCVVTNNAIGVFTQSGGIGTAAVLGTRPGTNLISGNTTDEYGNNSDGATSGSVPLH